MAKYCIRDAESDVLYDIFTSREEAEVALKEYEKADKEDGYYKPGSYVISEE